MVIADQTCSAKRDWLTDFVHASVSADPVMRVRHRSFLVVHLAVIAISLALLAGLAVSGLLASPLVYAAVPWLVLPVLLILFVARTGLLIVAQILSTLAFAATATFVAAITGGLASPLVVWLVLPPIEAALSGHRRVIAVAVGASFTGAALLTLSAATGYAPLALDVPVSDGLFVAISGLAALTYAALVAFRLLNLHRELSEAAEREQQRYRLLAENVTDMLLCFGRSGNVCFATGGLTKALGVEASALLGNGFLSRINVADRPAVLRAIDEAGVRGTAQTVEMRVPIIAGHGPAGTLPGDPDGTADRTADTIWLDLRCRKAEGSDAIVAVVRDISDHKRQSLALEDARAEAEQASIAKTRFLASISHELRTPLNAVIGFSEILSQELVGPLENDKQREYVDLIHDSGRHLLSVVNDILDMSKIETGKFEIIREPFDLADLVEQTARMMESEIGKRAMTIELDIARNIGEIHADVRACRQIFLNLLSNAVKFSEHGGHIVMGLHRTDDHAAIYVADQGIGILEQDIPRLCQPFVQVHSSYDKTYEGTGLGLSMVAGLVKLHGGHLEIESALGVGTRVTVKLPIDGLALEPPETGPVTVAPIDDSMAGGHVTRDGAAREVLKARDAGENVTAEARSVAADIDAETPKPVPQRLAG